MLTVIKDKNQPLRQDENLMLVEIRGLSTDTKPTKYYNKDINNGSVFIEMDTGTLYFFDYENQEWKEQ